MCDEMRICKMIAKVNELKSTPLSLHSSLSPPQFNACPRIILSIACSTLYLILLLKVCLMTIQKCTSDRCISSLGWLAIQLQNSESAFHSIHTHTLTYVCMYTNEKKQSTKSKTQKTRWSNCHSAVYEALFQNLPPSWSHLTPLTPKQKATNFQNSDCYLTNSRQWFVLLQFLSCFGFPFHYYNTGP